MGGTGSTAGVGCGAHGRPSTIYIYVIYENRLPNLISALTNGK